jgi:hypothetical protein
MTGAQDDALDIHNTSILILLNLCIVYDQFHGFIDWRTRQGERFTA